MKDRRLRSDRGVVVDHLPSNHNQLEPGYAIEVFQDGETLDVVFIPVSWATPLPQTWGTRESNSTEIRASS